MRSYNTWNWFRLIPVGVVFLDITVEAGRCIVYVLVGQMLLVWPVVLSHFVVVTVSVVVSNKVFVLNSVTVV